MHPHPKPQSLRGQPDGKPHGPEENMENGSRDLYTVAQAADYLQVSQSSIRSYIRQGMLKAYRIAGKRKVLIPREELLGLLAPARSDPQPPAEGSDATGEG
jgi:excisionase family DNA binding protein